MAAAERSPSASCALASVRQVPSRNGSSSRARRSASMPSATWSLLDEVTPQRLERVRRGQPQPVALDDDPLGVALLSQQVTAVEPGHFAPGRDRAGEVADGAGAAGAHQLGVELDDVARAVACQRQRVGVAAAGEERALTRLPRLEQAAQRRDGHLHPASPRRPGPTPATARLPARRGARRRRRAGRGTAGPSAPGRRRERSTGAWSPTTSKLPGSPTVSVGPATRVVVRVLAPLSSGRLRSAEAGPSPRRPRHERRPRALPTSSRSAPGPARPGGTSGASPPAPSAPRARRTRPRARASAAGSAVARRGCPRARRCRGARVASTVALSSRPRRASHVRASSTASMQERITNSRSGGWRCSIADRATTCPGGAGGGFGGLGYGLRTEGALVPRSRASGSLAAGRRRGPDLGRRALIPGVPHDAFGRPAARRGATSCLCADTGTTAARTRRTCSSATIRICPTPRTSLLDLAALPAPRST